MHLLCILGAWGQCSDSLIGWYARLLVLSVALRTKIFAEADAGWDTRSSASSAIWLNRPHGTEGSIVKKKHYGLSRKTQKCVTILADVIDPNHRRHCWHQHDFPMRMLILINARLLYYKFSLAYFILRKLVIKSSLHSAEGKLLYHRVGTYLPGEEENYLSFFSKGRVSPSPIFSHLPIYFYQYWSDTYFCYNEMLSSFISLLLIFQLRPLGALSGWPLCPFGVPQVVGFFLEQFPAFWHY